MNSIVESGSIKRRKTELPVQEHAGRTRGKTTMCLATDLKQKVANRSQVNFVMIAATNANYESRTKFLDCTSRGKNGTKYP
jgi:hypothetical protein